MVDAIGAVGVAWSSISRRLSANGGDSVYVIFKAEGVTGSPPDLVTDVEQAMLHANQMLVREGQDVVWAQGPMPSVKGPMVDIDWIGTTAENKQWLETFAGRLEQAGWSGTVTAAPQVWPRLVEELMSVPMITGFLAYSLTDPLAPLVGEDATAELCRCAVSWGAFPKAKTYLAEGTAQVQVDDPDVSSALYTAVRRYPHSQVTYLATKPTRFRYVAIFTDGQVCAQSYEQHTSWHDHVDRVRTALLQTPERLDLGLVRYAMGSPTSWMNLETSGPPTPFVDEAALRYNRHLWSQYTPDAHAIQVLTRVHLDKATDLTNWDTTALAGDRYLVQTRDLPAWFNDPVPDENLLTAARREFGNMIMTPKSIAADPHGHVRGTPLSVRPGSQ